MSKILYKVYNSETVNTNLESIYDLFAFRKSKLIEFKVDDKTNSKFKALWFKNNFQSIGIYVNDKLKSDIFNNLLDSYEFLLKNKETLFSDKNRVIVKCNNGKTVLTSFSLIELDSIIDLIAVLNKKNIIKRTVDIEKSKVDLIPVKSFQENKDKFAKVSKKINEIVPIKNIEEENKVFTVKVQFSNSFIVKHPKNRSNYNDALTLYKECKLKYELQNVILIKEENNVETILYSKDNNSKKDSSIQLSLFEELINLCDKVNQTKETLYGKISVLDKTINMLTHELENKSFGDDLNEYKKVVDNLKLYLDNRRDVKKALIINNKLMIKTEKLKDLRESFDLTKDTLYRYEKSGDFYKEGMIDIKTYKYENSSEYECLVSHFNGYSVRNNPEKKEITVYKKHYK